MRVRSGPGMSDVGAAASAMTPSGPAELLPVQRSEKSLHHVLGKENPNDLVGPQFERRRGNDFLRQPDRAQVIVQVVTPAAVESIAGQPDPGSALLPVAGASEIVPLGIGQEDLAAPVDALGTALEPPPQPRQWLQVGVLGHGDQEVRVLRFGLFCRQRADQGDPMYARDVSRRDGRRPEPPR